MNEQFGYLFGKKIEQAIYSKKGEMKWVPILTNRLL